jgi:hypothetical protein
MRIVILHKTRRLDGTERDRRTESVFLNLTLRNSILTLRTLEYEMMMYRTNLCVKDYDLIVLSITDLGSIRYAGEYG